MIASIGFIMYIVWFYFVNLVKVSMNRWTIEVCENENVFFEGWPCWITYRLYDSWNIALVCAWIITLCTNMFIHGLRIGDNMWSEFSLRSVSFWSHSRNLFRCALTKFLKFSGIPDRQKTFPYVHLYKLIFCKTRSYVRLWTFAYVNLCAHLLNNLKSTAYETHKDNRWYIIMLHCSIREQLFGWHIRL